SASPSRVGKYELEQTGLTGVHAVATGDIWARGVAGDWAGGIAARPFPAHWDGKRWSFVATPDPSADPASTLWGTDLWDSVAYAANDVWAVGRVGSDDPNGTTFTAHWDGTSWTQFPSQTLGEFWAVSPDGAG